MSVYEIINFAYKISCFKFFYVNKKNIKTTLPVYNYKLLHKYK